MKVLRLISLAVRITALKVNGAILNALLTLIRNKEEVTEND